MQIEEEDEQRSLLCCFCCGREASNPDFNKDNQYGPDFIIKKPNFESGYLIPPWKRKWNGKTMDMIRQSCPATKDLPSPRKAIQKHNKKTVDKEYNAMSMSMDINDVNNLLRRRLSLRVVLNEDDKSGERGEALLPQQGTFTEAAPILLSHLVKGSESRRSIVKTDKKDQYPRLSFSISKQSFEDLSAAGHSEDGSSIEQKSDKEFLDYLVKTSQFMKEVLEKDWGKTRNYVKWIENYIKSPRYAEKAQLSPEKWMVVLYTSSEDQRDQLTNFRCMLVRLLLQHHCVVYEERDVTLPQFDPEFQERLLGDRQNVPQVFMQGFNVGGYRVMYAIHKMNLTKMIFQKFIMPKDGYAEWMFNKEIKGTSLSLEVNLKAFPALQALAGSWSNDKLNPLHLEFVTMGKFVVKHAREMWYQMSSRPYIEPDLRRYALLRLTIIQTLCAMNKIYKMYLNKIEPDQSFRLRRKLSWLPRFSKQMPKD